jgi:lipoic acid synthetase
MAQKELFNNRPVIKRVAKLPPNPEAHAQEGNVKVGRFPSWLHRRLPRGTGLQDTQSILRSHKLNTVCEEAKCPNRFECHSKKTATFLTMGKDCTRNCGFCDIDFAKNPKPLEEDEPQRIAAAVRDLGLNHVVLTMVARDDLEDGGATQLAKIITEVRSLSPRMSIEVLVSDFEGKESSLDTILAARPDIFNHNIETVRELTPRVRNKATYDRTLFVLDYVKQHATYPVWIKSGIMAGLGETEEQMQQTIRDLKAVGCDIITMGQYLQPNPRKLLVKAFISPDQFKRYEDYGNSIGIKHMYCGPFVRSSYNADLIKDQIEKSLC